MGIDINTADDEFTPFLATDNQTLYFTSNGRSGYGEMDIYVSRRLDDTWMRWSEPENLGPAINTSDYEAHFTIPASGAYAYFCSAENSLGEFDIFRMKLPETIKPVPTVLLQGIVLDQITKQPVAAEVIVEDLDQNRHRSVWIMTRPLGILNWYSTLKSSTDLRHNARAINRAVW